MKKKDLLVAITVTFLFIAAFAVRLFLIQAQPHITEDGVMYARAAARLIEGQGFSNAYRPFYPLMTALFSLSVGDIELSGCLVSVFFGALLIFPLFFMARWAFGNRIAIISCLLAIIYPNLCEFSSSVLTESTFFFLFLLGLIMSWMVFTRGRPIFYLLAGLTWGLAFLTRAEGSAYFVFLVFIVLFKFFREKRIKLLSYLCLAIFGFLLISGPYLIYLKRKTGYWTFDNRADLALTLGEYVGKREDWGVAFDKHFFSLSEDGKKVSYEVILDKDKGMFAYIFSNPKEIFRRYIINLHLINKYVIPGLFPPLILILFAAGLFLGDIERIKKASVLFLAFIPYLVAPLFPVADRYFLLFVPIILVWAARGIVETSRWVITLKKGAGIKQDGLKNRQAFIEGLLVIFVIVSFIPFTFRPFLRNELGPNIYKEIGGWIKYSLPQDSVLICRKPWIPFYADREQVALPVAPLDKILKFARYRKAGYLIVDESVGDNRPNLKSLFENEPASENLKIIHKFKDKEGRKIYIYQIMD